MAIFKYLEGTYSEAAVLDVYKENKRRDETGESQTKASADAWTDNDRLRREQHERACRYWCFYTGLDHTYFPLSTDAVARLYMRYRKRKADEIEEKEKQIAESIRKLGKCASGD